MSQSAVIRARYVPDVRGVNRYKHFHSPLVTETNEAGENIDKRGLSHELPYLDTGDLIRYSGRLESDVAFTLSDDDYFHSKTGSDERFVRLAIKRHHRSCHAKLSESDTLRCVSGDSASLSPGSLTCKFNSSWPSSSLRLVQVPKVNEKKGRSLSCAISHRNSDVLSTSDTTSGREMVCQRKDPVLVECAAGNDETFGTKTFGTQTSVLFC
uniref:Uncharacterized protein n=1 Tax=Ascaris lumbricoides TaxID=6252 RepID=A0A0M3HF39_ASCLU